MATTTTKLALTKPDGTDLVDIAVLNANADKIDAASGATICTSTTRPATPFNGQLIFETDTLNALAYRTATTSWAIIGGSTVASAPPAGAGNGNFWWDSDNGKLYIYYNDGNSSQWVSVMPSTTQVVVSPNYIINGAFDIWQRGTTASTAGFLADRWASQITGGTGYTQSQQALDPGVSQATTGGQFYYRHQQTAGTGVGDYGIISNKIEDVRTLAGKTVTLSFWATADSARNLSIEFGQNFGTGGSVTVNAIGVTKLAVTTSVARYSVTVTIPSIAGKTVGAGSFLEAYLWFSAGSNWNARTNSLGNQSGTYTFNVWGVQLEEGSIATSFRRNQPNIQAELAACQRYYYRSTSSSVYTVHGNALGQTTSQVHIQTKFPVTMRIAPISIDYSGLLIWNNVNTWPITAASVDGNFMGTNYAGVIATTSATGITNGGFYTIISNNNSTGYLGFNAEV